MESDFKEGDMIKKMYHVPRHGYNTRSKTNFSKSSNEKVSLKEGRPPTPGIPSQRSRQQTLGNVTKESKGNRKRSFQGILQDPKSPNKPPSKSCRNTNSNTSTMDDISVATGSRVRYSNSTFSLAQDEKDRQTIAPEALVHTNNEYPLRESLSNTSEISYSLLSNASTWAVEAMMGSIATDIPPVRQQPDNHLRITISPDEEGCCRWQPHLVSRLSDIHIPFVSRDKVLLNYNHGGSIDLLGEGEYGYVVRGILREPATDLDVVAKYFKKDRSSIEDIMDEARIQIYLQDTGYVPRVYGLIEHGQKDCDPILIQECFGGGVTLDDLLDKSIPARVWFGLCLQVAKGLSRIHMKGVLINDIKLDNILVDCHNNSRNVRFIDMGIATFRSSYISGGTEAAMAGCCHLAPEVRKLKPSSPKSDIYGLGFVIRTIGEDADIEELVTLGSKLMSEKPIRRYSLNKTINRLHGFLKKQL